MLATTEKMTLTTMDLDAEAGFVLPPRETMLVTVVVNNVLNNLNIEIDVKNNQVAIQICALVQALATLITGTTTCTITKN